jgi:iron-sulfur cluster repair protein YtfE (RIC family)
MLTKIAARDPHRTDPSVGAVEMLQACHDRIRHFLQLSRTLADDPKAPPAQVAEAAAALFRYFNESLRLHEADENETLFPRLRNASIAAQPLREAAHAMVEQHHPIDELVSELVQFCKVIQRNPEMLPSISEQFKHVTAALQQMFEEHLRMEEAVIFPAVAQFPTGELEAMVREMQQRRRPAQEIRTTG